eukprot:10467485-Lingulodinium_polyedra.AAC.1
MGQAEIFKNQFPEIKTGVPAAAADGQQAQQGQPAKASTEGLPAGASAEEGKQEQPAKASQEGSAASSAEEIKQVQPAKASNE